MSNFSHSTGKFTYVWKIKNPQYCTQSMGMFIESPMFSVPQFHNTKWHLRLSSDIIAEDENNNDTEGFLGRVIDKGPEEIEIKCTLRLISDKEGHSTKNSFKKERGCWFPHFLPHHLNTYENSITVICEMEYEFGNVLYLEEGHSFSRNNSTFPIECFIVSKIIYQTKYVRQFIDSLVSETCSNITIPVNFQETYPSLFVNPSIINTCSRKLVPVIFQEKYPSLFISLRNISKDVIDVKVGLMSGEVEDSLIVICEMSVEDNARKVLYSFKEKHTFTDETVDVWCLANNINKSQLKAHLSDFSSNKLYLKIDLSISLGQSFSKIVREKLAVNVFANNQYIPSKEMYRLYKENKHCDFTLKADDKAIGVHKVVLEAASPVFAAMFANEMAEKENNAVDIKDLDKETVEKMVTFMYTGCVKELEYECAKKLFIAGDKYEITPLLDVVRDSIISLINSDTVCNLLNFADAHNDKKLEKEAVAFIKMNKVAVLHSSKWDIFEKDNLTLAANVLRKVCLFNKRKRI